MVKISIIIPVYNVEKYLRKCLESCVNQTMKEIEVIVINDDSPDNSKIIMEEYQQKYPQKVVNIFLNKNVRQGGARNIGIKRAKGEYLCFVDGDDYIDETMCEKLYAFCIDNNLDISCCNSYRVQKGRKIYWERFKRNDFEECNSLIRFTGQHCMIMRRQIITDNLLYYPENIFHEDTAVVPMWYLCAKKKGLMDLPLYYQIMHDDSSSGSMKEMDNIQILVALEELLRHAVRMNMYYEYKAIIDCFIFMRILVLAKRINQGTICFTEEGKKYLLEKIAVWSCYQFDEKLFYNHFTDSEYFMAKHLFAYNGDDLSGMVIQKNKCGENVYLDRFGNLKRMIGYIQNELHKNIVIWGTGERGISIINTIKKMGYHFWVGDNDSDKWGKELHTGDIIRDYIWIRQNVEKPIFLITATRFYNDICFMLQLEKNEAIDVMAYIENGWSVEHLIS